MGQDPDLIRRDIEETRERMGETVGALGYKADVKSRAKESVSDRMDSLKSKVTGVKDSATDATPSTGDVRQGARQAVGVAQENPLGMAVGAIAFGFLAGMLIPSTRIEDEKLGDVAEQVKDRVKETGQEALERGKEVASDAAQAAKDTAQESGRQHASALQDSAQAGAGAGAVPEPGRL